MFDGEFGSAHWVLLVAAGFGAIAIGAIVAHLMDGKWTRSDPPQGGWPPRSE